MAYPGAVVAAQAGEYADPNSHFLPAREMPEERQDHPTELPATPRDVLSGKHAMAQ